MIRFAAPELLALLILLPPFALLLLRAARLPRPRLLLPALPAAAPARPSAARFAPPALRIIAAALIIAAIARPQAATVEAARPAEGIDVVLAIDASSSMTREIAPDGGTRLEAARQVARDFVAGRGDDRVGLVMFQRRPVVLSPLTLDLGAIDSLLAGSVRSGLIVDGTGIGVALAESAALLRASDAPSRVVVLLTDGENNVPEITPVQAAAVARALGIRIYTVGLGGLDAEANVTLDEISLIYAADETGGRYFRASDAAELAAAYDEIDRLERDFLGAEEELRLRELAPWLLLAAALLLLAAAGLRAGPLGTVP